MAKTYTPITKMAREKMERDGLMERTRAAVSYVNTSNDEGVNLVAFMALFHPEVSDERVRQMRRELRRR